MLATVRGVPVQRLVDHTSYRLLKSKPEAELLELPNDFTLTSIYVCDGSSGHMQYKQLFPGEGISDSKIFLTSVVPLQLEDLNGKMAWKNPKPSFTRLCGPLRSEFTTETAEVIRVEVERIGDEIASLNQVQSNPSGAVVADRTFTVHHRLLLPW